jgi:hypothetical protein
MRWRLAILWTAARIFPVVLYSFGWLVWQGLKGNTTDQVTFGFKSREEGS